MLIARGKERRNRPGDPEVQGLQCRDRESWQWTLQFHLEYAVSGRMIGPAAGLGRIALHTDNDRTSAFSDSILR